MKQFEDPKERCKGLQGFRNELERQLERTERDEGETHKKHHSSEGRLKGDRMTIAYIVTREENKSFSTSAVFEAERHCSTGGSDYTLRKRGFALRIIK